jgi:hypothetical protein
MTHTPARRVLALLLGASMLWCVTPAFAQVPDAGEVAALDAGAGPVISAAPVIPDDTAGTGSLIVTGFKDVKTAFKDGKVFLGLMVLLSLVVRLLVRLGGKLPGKVGAWFVSKWAIWLLPILLSLTAGLVTFAATKDFGSLVDVVLGSLTVAFMGGGHYPWESSPGQAVPPAPPANS